MRIDRNLSEARQAELAQRLRDSAGRSDSSTPVPAIEPVTRVDRVEISDAGRALAARQERPAGDGELTPERIDALRLRVRDGSYNSPAVADAVARRLLGQGEL